MAKLRRTPPSVAAAGSSTCQTSALGPSHSTKGQSLDEDARKGREVLAGGQGVIPARNEGCQEQGGSDRQERGGGEAEDEAFCSQPQPGKPFPLPELLRRQGSCPRLKRLPRGVHALVLQAHAGSGTALEVRSYG